MCYLYISIKEGITAMLHQNGNLSCATEKTELYLRYIKDRITGRLYLGYIREGITNVLLQRGNYSCTTIKDI